MNQIILINERNDKFDDSPMHNIHIRGRIHKILSPLPIALSYMCVVNYKDDIFVSGGWSQTDAILSPMRSVFR